MDTIVAAAIGGLLGFLGTVIPWILENRKGRNEVQTKLQKAMDEVLHLLNKRQREREQAPRAMEIYRELTPEYSMNIVVAGLYMLKEKEMISWEEREILKPGHRVDLVNK